MSHLDYEINKELGECYLFMGDYDKAEEYYTKAMSSNGIHPDPYMGLATIAVQRGDLDKAIVFYQKADKVERTDKSLSGMALVESETGKENDAFDHFALALGINPENIVALFGLVRLGHTLERLGEVAPHLENFLQIDPTNHDVRYCLAGCLMCIGRREEAMAHIEMILESDPENAAAKELYTELQAAA